MSARADWATESVQQFAEAVQEFYRHIDDLKSDLGEKRFKRIEAAFPAVLAINDNSHLAIMALARDMKDGA